MDRDIAPGLRLRLILGKFRVIKLDKGVAGFRAIIDFTNSVKITVDCPIEADIRLNDLLTFYTEVPLADVIETSVQ
jgi:hypothetical protein